MFPENAFLYIALVEVAAFFAVVSFVSIEDAVRRRA
jgi:hypothetical protein